MCRLIESIKIYNGEAFNLDRHQARVDRASQTLFGKAGINLRNAISIPENCRSGLFKCRIVYDTAIRTIDYLPYEKRTIRSLKKVWAELDYGLKFENRNGLDQCFHSRGECDDILIIKDGFATDWYAGNLVFFDGKDFYTPSTPLLNGSKRDQLLDEGRIREAAVRESDLREFKEIHLINAMLDLGESVVSIDRVV